jgi:hypothetical protein
VRKRRVWPRAATRARMAATRRGRDGFMGAPVVELARVLILWDAV